MEYKVGNDYQWGHCHFFARYFKKVFQKLLPNKEIKFYLLLANRIDDEDEVIDEVLIHAYLKIDDYYIDSEGVFDEEETERRVMEWADREKDLTPDGYDFGTWEDVTDEIPEIFFNRFCSTKHLEQDVRQFMNRPDIINILKQFQSKIIDEKWSMRYKKSINCNNPKGFSQRAHCQGRKKRKK